MRVTETCGCGATCTVEHNYAPSVQLTLSAWRRDHKHAEADGNESEGEVK